MCRQFTAQRGPSRRKNGAQNPDPDMSVRHLTQAPTHFLQALLVLTVLIRGSQARPSTVVIQFWRSLHPAQSLSFEAALRAWFWQSFPL